MHGKPRNPAELWGNCPMNPSKPTEGCEDDMEQYAEQQADPKLMQKVIDMREKIENNQ